MVDGGSISGVFLIFHRFSLKIWVSVIFHMTIKEGGDFPRWHSSFVRWPSTCADGWLPKCHLRPCTTHTFVQRTRMWQEGLPTSHAMQLPDSEIGRNFYGWRGVDFRIFTVQNLAMSYSLSKKNSQKLLLLSFWYYTKHANCHFNWLGKASQIKHVLSDGKLSEWD